MVNSGIIRTVIRAANTSRIEEALRAVLPAGTVVAVLPRDGVASTFSVRVRAGRLDHDFVAGWSTQGWPGDVQRLCLLAPDIDIVMAPVLSEGAWQWLADHDRGWLDETGHARLVLASGLLIKQRPARRPAAGRLRNKWTKATVSAAEAALAGVTPTVRHIEQAAGLSRGATADALTRLENFGLLDRSDAHGRTSARRIADRDGLLDQYAAAAAAAAAAQAREMSVLIHKLTHDPLADLEAAVAPALNKAGVDWAVTGAAASTLIAPYLSEVTIVELYVQGPLAGDPAGIAKLMKGRVVDKGHRYVVRRAPTRLTTEGPVVGQVRVALPVRVYADLLAVGGRYAEAAQHLKEVLNA